MSILPIEQVERAFEAMAADASVRGRLALISVLSKHGERVWVTELTYQLWRAGAIARAEFSGRTDIVLQEEFFEVKSSRTGFALRKSTKGEIDRWFAADIAKLRVRQGAGHFIITICTIVEPWRLPFRPPDGRADLRQDWKADRDRAIGVYRQYASNYATGEIRHIDLGEGEIPPGLGFVQLDALLFSVHPPAP